jgi:anti-sigma regulatory factor (Ser/Thr protein kinase)
MTACGDDTRCSEGGAPMSGETTVLGVITLAGVASSVASARGFVRRTLGPPHPALDDVALCVSELATNAIKHTPTGDGGKITVGLTAVGSVIRAEVTNDGVAGSRPHARNDPEAEDGRGILIVEAVATTWGVIEQAGATTVWAEFPA